MGMNLPALSNDLSRDDWIEYGRGLKRVEHVWMWKLGEWWNIGLRHSGWGSGPALAKEVGLPYETCRAAGKVDAAVELGIRIPNLTWAHHQAVAYLEPDEQKRFLIDWSTRADPPTVAEARREVRQLKSRRDRPQLDVTPAIPVTFKHGDMVDVLAATADRFDLIIADPPYNVTDWEWDRRGLPQQFVAESRRWLEHCLSVCADEYNLFWFCSPVYAADLEPIMRELGTVQSRIVWHRRNMAMGSDAQYRFVDSWEMIYHLGNRKLNFPIDWNSERFDVQTFAVPQTNFDDEKLHPTQKPLELIRWLIRYGSYEGDKILDPFAGSGTTGHASILEGNRICTLIDQNDDYITIAKQRIEQL